MAEKGFETLFKSALCDLLVSYIIGNITSANLETRMFD